MPTGLLPIPAPSTGVRPVEPKAVVEALLAALAAGDLDTLRSVLAEDVVYSNVGLPTIRGRRRTVGVLAPLAGRLSFEAYLHAISSSGAVVLTERTDVVQWGRLRVQFWVAGRFDVHDGQITLWRDAFDFLDTTRAFWRGVLGAVVPALRPQQPTSLDTAPGR
jgi:limonene-1,2-epoxide hydrolase